MWDTLWNFINFVRPLAFLGSLIFFVSFVIFLTLHILNAIALFELAKNNGYEDIAALAWIPFINMYLVGIMSGGINFVGVQKINGNILGLILAITPLIIDRIPIIGFLLWIVFIIIQLQALFNFYSRIDKSIAILIAILGAIPPTSPIAIIYLFYYISIFFKCLFMKEFYLCRYLHFMDIIFLKGVHIKFFHSFRKSYLS